MFQTRIKKLREDVGFKSQQAFARQFGVAQSTVGGWESGAREPNIDKLLELAKVFHCSVDYLVGGTVEKELSEKQIFDLLTENKFRERLRTEINHQYEGNIDNLAADLRVSPISIEHWLSGVTEPGLNSLIQLAYVLRVSVDYLLGIEERWGKISSSDLTNEEQAIILAWRDADMYDRNTVAAALGRYGFSYVQDTDTTSAG